jgi:endogenous inhibitor of DNA gyrase (YacG/DUF329 family)
MDTIAVLTDADQDEFLAAVAKGFCPECGKAVVQNPRGRHKKFCSEACRFAWKNKHPNPENWKKVETFICPVCGREFRDRCYGDVKRKYCSRACANHARAMRAAEGSGDG